MSIDPATGLPELPPGEYWRIERHRVSILRDLPAGDWQTCKCGPSRHRRDERETRTVSVVSLRSYWGRTRERRIELVECRRKSRTETVKGKIWGEWEFEGIYGPFLEEADPVTPDNVIERCETVLADRDADAIVGDYPPKKLETK